jgi:hypothetical protein
MNRSYLVKTDMTCQLCNPYLYFDGHSSNEFPFFEKKNIYIHETEQALRDAPQGYLRVNKGKNGTQYYFRNDAKDFNGTYVRKKDFELVRSIAQRDYDTKLLEEIRIQRQKTEEVLEMIQKEQLRAIYDDFSEERKVLISKRVVSPEEYAKVWEKDPSIPILHCLTNGQAKSTIGNISG